jgi:hypothetical protein
MELKHLKMPGQRYSANDHRKDSMINHIESNLNCLGIDPRPPDSRSIAPPFELTGRTLDKLLDAKFLPYHGAYTM